MSTRTYKSTIDAAWSVAYSVAPDEAGEPVVASLRITPKATVPAGGITRHVLRRISIAASLRKARFARGGPKMPKPSASGPGRPRLVGPEIERMYRRYKDLAAQGHPKPHVVLAAEHPDVSVSAIRQRVSRWLRS